MAASGKLQLRRLLFAIGAVGYVVGAIIISFFLGAFDFHAPEKLPSLRERNAVFAMPIFTVYLWLANQYLESRTLICTSQFIRKNQLLLKPRAAAMMVKSRSSINIKIASLVGTVVAFGYMYFEGLLAYDLRPLLLFLNMLAVPFWIMSVFLTLQLIFITRFVIKHFLSAKSIDLFGIKKLSSISDLVITNTVISALCLALIPLFWLGKPIPPADKYIVAGFFVMLCWFLFWPVLSVQQTISSKKSMAIERINESVKALFDSKTKSDRRLTDNPERLRQLSALISAKQEIANASEWPINLPQSLKGLFFALSIPLSWVAGSLIETFISKLNML